MTLKTLAAVIGVVCLVACAGSGPGDDGDGMDEQPIVNPGALPPGRYEGSKELMSFTVDNPSGANLGCIPMGSRLPVSITIPPPAGCTVDPAFQSSDDFRFTCRIPGSGGHYTPQPNPYEDQTFQLVVSTTPVQIGSCTYYTAIGTMRDQDNWRDCRSHEWTVRAYQLIACA